VRIRPASDDDAAAIRSIYEPVVRDTPISFEENAPDTDEIVRRIRDSIAWLVCDVDGIVAGYAYAGRFHQRAAYRWSAEVSLYVAPEHQRKGSGSRLLAALLDELRRQGFANALAGIALPNDASVHLFESFGFRRVALYERIGFKLDRWHNVGWWQLRLDETAPGARGDIEVRRAEANDRDAIDAFLDDRGSVRVARLGELVDARAHPALVAREGGRLVGVLTYILTSDACEILTLHTVEQWWGAGTALIGAVEDIAKREGCGRLFLITTNDNLDALRFYQRRGFELCALHRGAVDYSRAHLKPEIPTRGDYGIALRDELELDKRLVMRQ
jgi:L-amino acid N-acyltransferase YncA